MNKFFPIFFASALLLFYSCSGITQIRSNSVLSNKIQRDIIPEWPREIYDSLYGQIKLDYLISNDTLPCHSKTTIGWGLAGFLPKEERTVGIWPYEFTVSNLKRMKNYWGYSKLFFAFGNDTAKWDSAISAGYSLEDIMIALHETPEEKRKSLIKFYGNAFAYYIDEPADQNNSFHGIKSSLIDLKFNSLFVISGYKRTDALDNAVKEADLVMFSSYKHWWECLPGIWCAWPIDYDQRPDWSDMKDRYGSKFSMTWIKTSEVTEFENLFEQAKYLGINSVWIYGFLENSGQPVDHYNDQFENISFAAFNYGFLKMKQRQFKIEWFCDNIDPCNSCDTSKAKMWRIEKITPTSTYRFIEK